MHSRILSEGKCIGNINGDLNFQDVTRINLVIYNKYSYDIVS